MRRIPLYVAVLLTVTGCDYLPATSDEPAKVINITASSQAKDYSSINDLPCMVTIRGTIGDAIKDFERSCGVTAQRNCYPIEDDIHQCTNQSSTTVSVPEVVIPHVVPTAVAVEETAVPVPVTTVVPEPVTSATPVIESVVEEKALEEETATPVFSEDMSMIDKGINTVVAAEQITVQPTTIAEIINVEKSDDFCHGDDMTLLEAKSFFKSACASNGFNNVSCGATGWACSNGDVSNTELPAIAKVVKQEVIKPVAKTIKPKAKPKAKPTVIDISNTTSTSVERSSDLIADSGDVTENNTVMFGDEWADVINSGGNVWVAGVSDNLTAVVQYILLVHPNTNTRRINVVAAGVDTQDPLWYDIIHYSNFIAVNTNDAAEIYIAENATFM